jgi:uncharacterized protein (DUF302 family)
MSAPAGVVTVASPHSVGQTVDRLLTLIARRELTLFAVVDHSRGARDMGLDMPETKVVMFGSPRAGTPLMLLQPLSALDLPMKVLVRAAPDAPGALVSFLTAAELADRYDLPAELVAPLDGVRTLVEETVAEGEIECASVS